MEAIDLMNEIEAYRKTHTKFLSTSHTFSLSEYRKIEDLLIEKHKELDIQIKNNIVKITIHINQTS